MGDSPQRSGGEQGWVPTAIGFSIGIVVAWARGELNKKLDLIVRIAMTRWPWDAGKEKQNVPLLSVIVQGMQDADNFWAAWSDSGWDSWNTGLKLERSHLPRTFGKNSHLHSQPASSPP